MTFCRSYFALIIVVMFFSIPLMVGPALTGFSVIERVHDVVGSVSNQIYVFFTLLFVALMLVVELVKTYPVNSVLYFKDHTHSSAWGRTIDHVEKDIALIMERLKQ